MYLKLIELFGNSEQLVPFWNAVGSKATGKDFLHVELLPILQ